MSKKDRIGRELDFFMERHKSVFMVFLALCVGESSLIYAVVSGEKPLGVLALALIGAVVAFVLFMNLRTIRLEIRANLDELEALDD
ncbi:MAG: hypothetical protein AB7E49_02240 [Campylobacterales bacterium]